ncbi:MAG: MFS transporter [Alphaproteobacteria bacterium]|nr:MFS transporter [Alphaproteobacteria bacterium]
MSITTRHPWFWPLVVTALMQTESAYLSRAIPVVGPVITEAAGVGPEYIGYLTSMISLGTMWFLMAGGPMLRRLGPTRLLQCGAITGALATLAITTGNMPMLLLGALFIGVGYGPSPPAGSDILSRNSPPGARSLIFSIKQSAVPLGGALAGLIVPTLTIAYDWRIAMVVSALLAFACALAVQPLRAGIDVTRNSEGSLGLAGFLSPRSLAAPFRAMRLSPLLWPLSYVGSCFAVVQGCLFAFHVTYLTTELGFSLAVAGFVFATMQIIGVFARVIMGWVADRLGSALRALLLLSGASATMALATAAIGSAWPVWLVTAVAAVTGFAAASWNGVYLSEVAHVVGSEHVGDATSGSTFFTFIGYVVGTSAFATAVAVNGSYALTFAIIAAMPVSAGFVLLRLVRR